MKKRILAIVTAAVMCVQGVCFAKADDYDPYTIPDDWTIGYVNGAGIDKQSNYFQVTKNAAYEGENSLEVCYPLGDQGNGTAIVLRNYSVSGFEAGTYSISFCVKAEAKGTPIKLHLEQEGADFTKELKYFYAPTAGIKVEELADGWFRYTMTARTTSKMVQFYFEVFDKIEQPVYIDNVCINRADDSKNLILNGGFENVTVESKVLKYEPLNVLVSERDKSILTPSWKNPNTEAEQIRLYDVTDGKNVLLSDNFDVSAGAYNHFLVDDLEAEKEYSFKIEFDFGSAGIREFYTYGVTNVRNIHNAGGWSSEYSHGIEYNYTPVWAGMDGDTKHSGAAALNAKSNLNAENGLFLELNIPFSNIFEQNKKYRVSIWAKGEQTQAKAARILMEGSQIGDIGVSENFDWTQFVYDYNTAQNATSGCLKFWIMRPAKNLWLDDLEIYELSEDGEAVGENLVADTDVAGFEKDFNAAQPTDIRAAAAKPMSRQATLSWSIPASSSHDKIKIYQVIDEEIVLRGVLPAQAKEITLSHLNNEQEYTYIIKTVSKYGIESQGTEVKVTPVTPELEILPLKVNGEHAAIKDGINTFDLTVMNNFGPENFEAELIAALFTDDGEYLSYIDCDSAKLSAGEEKTLSVQLDIPNDGKSYIAEIYVWNRLFGLDSIQKVTHFDILR